MKVCVVGLGYVGLPLAVEFAKHVDVIGFDVNKEKIELLLQGVDPTHEVGDDVVKNTKVFFTCDSSKIKDADFVVVAVPTPIDKDNVPDLSYVLSASEIVGKNLKKHAVVVFESTVYPGCTEQDCLPLLEKFSGFSLADDDFGLGYSPERINPGDKKHTLSSIVKVVSANNIKTLEQVVKLYSLVVKAGIHKASSIKVAEAAKVIENVQRDLNIALMNELSIIFEKLGVNTYEVLEAAGTKWNFHKYTPGLVGGHCIGVDPYYLTYKAQMHNYDSKVILSGRKINDDMHLHFVDLFEKKIVGLKGKKILIVGLTFKENVPDYRNSRAKQLVMALKEKKALVYGFDPYLSRNVIEKEFGCVYVDKIDSGYDLIALISPHDSVLKIIPLDVLLFDMKNVLKRKDNYFTL